MIPPGFKVIAFIIHFYQHFLHNFEATTVNINHLRDYKEDKTFVLGGVVDSYMVVSAVYYTSGRSEDSQVCKEKDT